MLCTADGRRQSTTRSERDATNTVDESVFMLNMSELLCQFCENSGSNEKVLLFNENTLEKCRAVLHIRVTRNLKYAELQLPNNLEIRRGYHVSCYKKFTAVKSTSTLSRKCTKKKIVSDTADPAQEIIPTVPILPTTTDLAIDHTLSRSSTDLLTDPKLIITGRELDLKCIFCNQQRKQVKRKSIILHKLESNDMHKLICTVALELGENCLHDTVNRTKDSFYHPCCLHAFLKKSSTSFSQDSQSDEERAYWHQSRIIHKKAFENIENLVKNRVIQENQVYLMSNLHDKYMSYCNDDVPAIKASRLEQKIKEIFREQITIQVIKGLKLVFKTGTLMSVLESSQEDFVKKDILRSAANILRREILSLPVTPLPTNCSVEELLKGECGIPNALKEFNILLLGGDNVRRMSSEVTTKRAESISQDQIYAVTNGRTKPSKQLALGMAIKSLTNSKKIINILNKYGQIPSYTLLEELETEMTYATMNNPATTLIPPGIIPCSNLNTGVAYDNFDRYVETATGKDTLHDTVGIIFQNEIGICQPEQTTQNLPLDLTKKSREGKRRRAFDNIDTNIVHPTKKPKMGDKLINVDSDVRELSESVIVNAKNRDLLWLLCHAAGIENSPMWVGFNNLTTIDDSLKQNIAYLNPINMSPTNASVVKTTMENAKQIAEQCNQEYICVTYDLAIAKVALQIQSAERPYFDNLFILLGSFHINMAYFKAIGKFINDCGLTHIMVEAELLASGSVNGFICGTHFNRCKRLHPILSLALQLLHFQFFLKTEKLQQTNDLIEELKEIAERKMGISENILADVHNPLLSEIIVKYKQFQKISLDGSHGKTAQFYMIYINLIEYYFLLNRSVRENNFELYKYVLPKITNIFFNPNYARWLTKHHDDLLRVQETHPGLEHQLKHGGLGIKRTNKAFSRQPVDLTLEQTINADAAKRLSGMSHFTNSISGRQRWAKSHALRSTVVSHVLTETNINTNQDVSRELEQCNIIKNKNAVKKLLETVECYGNPFDYQNNKDELFNIVTAKSVTKETSDFLLNLESAGETLRLNFISECNKDSDRFEKPIKQFKLKNFAADKIKTKCKTAQNLESVKEQRGLFGRLLGISLNQKLDLSKVLEFPLTATPPSMTHTDGSMMKTNKAILMKILENGTKAVTDQLPQKIDVIIIDGFYFLHLLPDFPKTFGDTSLYILKKINTYNAKRIDIIFDSYIAPSIKDLERDARKSSDTISQYKITGPKQVRPQNFIQELRNTQFKEELVHFLMRHWTSEEAAVYIKGKTLNLNFENQCLSYKSDGMAVIRTENNELKCGAHEETDSKIAYHIHGIHSPSNIVVKSSDTDVMIILLGNFDKLDAHQIYMESGTTAKRRIIHINEIYISIGANLAKSLPAFHALTGCDYVPAFHRKGKQRPYMILSKNKDYQDALIALSDDQPLTNTTSEKIEQFVCDIYSVNAKSVNDARHKMFLKKFKPNRENEKFVKSLTNFDASSMPPSKVELDQQILRARYVSNIWSNACKETPSSLSPVDHGWAEDNGKYVLFWYTGNQLPSSVADVTIANQENESDSSVCLESDEDDDL